jgi:hypothetical protein
MKNIALILILFTGVVLFDACTKVETDPVLDMSTAVAPAITSPGEGTTIVLEQANENDEIVIEWSAATYNLTDLPNPTYVLKMAIADSSYDTGKDAVVTTETNFTTTVGALNSQLISMGVTPGAATPIKWKVVASLRTAATGAVIETSVTESPNTNTTFTAYSAEVVYPKLWVPGEYQGWSPGDAWYVQSFEDNGIFTGYIYFPEDAATFQFKFTSEPSWDGTNYGAGDAAGTLSTDGGAGNLEVPGPGGYRFNVNTNDLTWTFELQNFGVIGEFTDWAEDIDMVWDNDNNMLTLTYDVPAKENNRFKFRANDDWALNYGDVDPPDGQTLRDGGNDIPIQSGSYTFHLMLYGPEPMYELIKN